MNAAGRQPIQSGPTPLGEPAAVPSGRVFRAQRDTKEGGPGRIRTSASESKCLLLWPLSYRPAMPSVRPWCFQGILGRYGVSLRITTYRHRHAGANAGCEPADRGAAAGGG
jgi:hypothetical protein